MRFDTVRKKRSCPGKSSRRFFDDFDDKLFEILVSGRGIASTLQYVTLHKEFKLQMFGELGVCAMFRQDSQRFMEPNELMAAQTIPTSRLQARKCQAPQVDVQGIGHSSVCRMAGNSMSIPCVAAVLFCASLALQPISN